MVDILVNGVTQVAQHGERLIEVINRSGAMLPQAFYHPQPGPIQTCDTCIVEADGGLVRASAATVSADMIISTHSERAAAAQTEAFNCILSSHVLYIARCAITITETAPFTTRRSCWLLSSFVQIQTK